jgi:UrcA family protein
MLKTALFAAAAALATVATSAPVLAKDVTVRYGDLDLASAKGQNELSHRIQRAARTACDFTADGRIPSHSAQECYRKAHAKAQTEMASLIDDSHLGG